MEFPTYKEFGEKVAKEALDVFEYKGKTLRQWVEIIASNDGDTISRKAAIEAVGKLCDECDNGGWCGECRIDYPGKDAKSVLEALPSLDEPSQVAMDISRIIENEKDMRVIAQPEIIRCKDCKYWDTTWQNDYAPNYHYCPMIDGTHRNNFYCAYAERRTDG